MEKSPLQSKKFVAYLVAELSWKIILVVALLVFRDQLADASASAWWFMFTVVIVAGFVEVGTIGGQAWLDKYVRVAQIAANVPGAVKATTDQGTGGAPEETT